MLGMSDEEEVYSDDDFEENEFEDDIDENESEEDSEEESEKGSDAGNSDDEEDEADSEDEEDVEAEVLEDNIVDVTENPKKTISSPYITNFEYAKVITFRAQQLENPAIRPLVDTTGMICPIKVAMKELQQRKIPLGIKRIFPDGSYEIRNFQSTDPDTMIILKL